MYYFITSMYELQVVSHLSQYSNKQLIFSTFFLPLSCKYENTALNYQSFCVIIVQGVLSILLLEVLMSRIMILGAGRGQVDLIRAVKKYGHTAIVASIPGNYPGFDHADEICHVDISDPLAVEQEVLARGIEGITTCCLDTGMESYGYICEKYHFMGPPAEAAKTARDKHLMKEKFAQGNVRTAKYRKITCKEDLSHIPQQLSFPMIVKAVDQQGSRGLNIAETEAELLAAWDATMKETQKDYCIVEEYLSGPKHGVNGCIIDGKIVFLIASQDITDKNAVLGHILPFKVDADLHRDIMDQSMAAVRAVGLNHCIFNIDFILHKGQVFIIEVTGRLGANGIPDLLSLYYGIDIYKILSDIAAGVNPVKELPQELTPKTACCSKMLTSQTDGVLKAILNENPPDPHIVSISYFVSPGERVHLYRSAKDCVGQIILQGPTAKDCQEQIEKIEARIDFILEE